jgi:hypothetical protein
MCSHENPDEGTAFLQLNSELQRAQLDLLTAHSTTHQLRLRYSSDDLAHFGRRDVLRKSAQAASALHEYYSAIEKRIPQAPPAAVPAVTPQQIASAVDWLASYLRRQRAHFLPSALPLNQHYKEFLSPYFPASTLDRVRIVELHGVRLTVPDFYAQAQALGFDNLPAVSHMDSLTFIDVIAFNEKLTDRALFHALVHALQIDILGLERYAELWVLSFLKTRAHFTVPLEVHAFALASKFVRPVPERFSVDQQVRRWIEEQRY